MLTVRSLFKTTQFVRGAAIGCPPSIKVTRLQRGVFAVVYVLSCASVPAYVTWKFPQWQAAKA